jgi:hypothetical protein
MQRRGGWNLATPQFFDDSLLGGVAMRINRVEVNASENSTTMFVAGGVGAPAVTGTATARSTAQATSYYGSMTRIGVGSASSSTNSTGRLDFQSQMTRRWGLGSQANTMSTIFSLPVFGPGARFFVGLSNNFLTGIEPFSAGAMGFMCQAADTTIQIAVVPVTAGVNGRYLDTGFPRPVGQGATGSTDNDVFEAIFKSHFLNGVFAGVWATLHRINPDRHAVIYNDLIPLDLPAPFNNNPISGLNGMAALSFHVNTGTTASAVAMDVCGGVAITEPA